MAAGPSAPGRVDRPKPDAGGRDRCKTALLRKRRRWRRRIRCGMGACGAVRPCFGRGRTTRGGADRWPRNRAGRQFDLWHAGRYPGRCCARRRPISRQIPTPALAQIRPGAPSAHPVSAEGWVDGVAPALLATTRVCGRAPALAIERLAAYRLLVRPVLLAMAGCKPCLRRVRLTHHRHPLRPWVDGASSGSGWTAGSATPGRHRPASRCYGRRCAYTCRRSPFIAKACQPAATVTVWT